MRIHVGRLPSSLSGRALRALFEAYGRVAAVSVLGRGAHRHAFVEMSDPRRARAAIQALAPRWAVAQALPARVRETQGELGDFAR